MKFVIAAAVRSKRTLIKRREIFDQIGKNTRNLAGILDLLSGE
jgi:hypothetical protein